MPLVWILPCSIAAEGPAEDLQYSVSGVPSRAATLATVALVSDCAQNAIHVGQSCKVPAETLSRPMLLVRHPVPMEAQRYHIVGVDTQGLTSLAQRTTQFLTHVLLEVVDWLACYHLGKDLMREQERQEDLLHGASGPVQQGNICPIQIWHVLLL